MLGLPNTNAPAVSYLLETIGYSNKITINSQDLNGMSHLIIPGIGFISAITEEIDAIVGLREQIVAFCQSGKPVLGICLGMQLLGFSSEENILAKCLGISEFKTESLANHISTNSVPHIGWNQVSYSQTSEIFTGIPDNTDFYFSHSFAVMSSDLSTSTTNFEIDFVSSIKFNNVFGVQFHPERSQKFGIKLLENFLRL